MTPLLPSEYSAPPAPVGVAILARAPIPGEAKTRLIPKLGTDGAAKLHSWMLQRTVAMALIADVGPVSLWCEGDIRHRDFERCSALGAISLHTQVQSDLGTRMWIAMNHAATADGALVIGTDCPAMTIGHLRDAALSLGGQDAVAIPVEDGGYALLGMKRPSLEVFANVDWGSERVMTQTRHRLAVMGLSWRELDYLWDVDRPDDVDRLLAMCPELFEMLVDSCQST
ncbi:MAG: TIGR04282 family arsenosugar biosynthesis glycosyltransferase [Sulfuritalea sp.]|nr:TIGR04282 family arsenosugar biosynthesis glycosyltransferase [Sulfuritalea sp.]